MTSTLPMFPLELVAFPGEELAIHIFENRYIQLLDDCENENGTFGIPTYVNNQMRYGTEMQLLEVVKRYDSGSSDIRCLGLRTFELTDFYKTLGDKLYAGASVRFIEDVDDSDASLRSRFITLLKAFYDELDIETPMIDPRTIRSYTLAHKMGLTLDQEYELLQITSEKMRYQFLIDHLSVIVPTIKSINRTKELIKLNGHFKNFNPLDFKDFMNN